MKRIVAYIILIMLAAHSQAAIWQWSVEVDSFISTETNSHPRAFLWIPEDCKQVKAIVFGQHNMCEETIFEHPTFRKTMSELGFAIVWVTPGFEQKWDVANGCQRHFDTMISDLAEVSGYSELKYAPIVPLGHSAMATFPWNFAAWNPERTLAIISYHGDAPRTNLTGYGRENIEWGRTRNIDGIPGLMIEGEYEWWEARVNPALAFRMMYPESCISFLCDAGRGHFDVSDEVVAYISEFLRKSAQYRLPNNMSLNKLTELTKLDVQKGWLAERWHPNQKNRSRTAPFADYMGDKHDAFWYFDKDMAELTEAYYSRENNKQSQFIGFYQDGQKMKYHAEAHGKYRVRLEALDSDLKFNISAQYTDTLREKTTNNHSKEKIKIYPLCGPVKQIDDSTFTIRFYHMGLDNKRRTSSIWLIAQGNGDDVYKTSVQEISIDFSYPQTEGKEQQIRFSVIPNVREGIQSIPLKGKSDKGLPVYYYVKEGPAKVDSNNLIFTPIPPRSKYPVKVTVVAWQYGQTKGDKIQSAEPIERTFYIERAR